MVPPDEKSGGPHLLALALRRIARGAKGHPGTGWLMFLTLLGALAGEARGGFWPLWGAMIMLAVYGPLWMMGAYARGKARPHDN